MSTPSSLTLNYNAVLASTLFNYRKKFYDAVSTSNAFFYLLMKKGKGYIGLSALGERAKIDLMYELGSADSYTGYDELPIDPMDGFTSAFWDWRQAAVPIAISGLEELKNSGKYRMFSLIKGKVKQARLGIQEFFAKKFLQGNGDGALATAYTSANNGSTFIDPLFKLIAKLPTGSATIGNIDQSAYSWWQNQYKESAADSYAKFRNELRNMYHNCGKGPGGMPNLHLTDQETFELYEKALEHFHRNPSYESADIPFDNILFKKKPVVWDEFMPDLYSGTISRSYGTWVMVNTEFFEIQYAKKRNFVPTNMEKPMDQDARASHILWAGAALCSNRRKQGVIHKIDTSIAS